MRKAFSPNATGILTQSNSLSRYGKLWMKPAEQSGVLEAMQNWYRDILHIYMACSWLKPTTIPIILLLINFHISLAGKNLAILRLTIPPFKYIKHFYILAF